jgi:hypothetical protein
LFQTDGVQSIVRTPLYTNLPCTGLSVHAVVGPVIIRIAMYEQPPNKAVKQDAQARQQYKTSNFTSV